MTKLMTTIGLVDQMTAPMAAIQNTISNLEYRFNSLDSAADIDSGTLTAMKNQLAMTGSAAQVLADNMRLVQDEIQNANGSQKQFNNSLNAGRGAAGGLLGKIGAMAAAYAGIHTVKNVIGLADELTNTTARLNLMNDGMQTTKELQDMVYASAQRSRSSYQATADTVAKLGITAKDAFSGNKEMIVFAEQMNKQFVIGGASVQDDKADLFDGVVPVEQLPPMDYDPSGTASEAVDAHNLSGAAHADIKDSMAELETEITAAQNTANTAQNTANTAQATANTASTVANAKANKTLSNVSGADFAAKAAEAGVGGGGSGGGEDPRLEPFVIGEGVAGTTYLPDTGDEVPIDLAYIREATKDYGGLLGILGILDINNYHADSSSGNWFDEYYLDNLCYYGGILGLLGFYQYGEFDSYSAQQVVEGGGLLGAVTMAQNAQSTANNAANKTLSNVTNASFAAKATAAGVGGATFVKRSHKGGNAPQGVTSSFPTIQTRSVIPA